MKSRLIFKVEKKIGSLPDISYKTLFEREIQIDSDNLDSPGYEDIVKVLSYLYPDPGQRVLIICE